MEAWTCASSINSGCALSKSLISAPMCYQRFTLVVSVKLQRMLHFLTTPTVIPLGSSKNLPRDTVFLSNHC